ncbi:MAG: CHRD domain-containing protein [Candidatus Competibacterales bacterium]
MNADHPANRRQRPRPWGRAFLLPALLGVLGFGPSLGLGQTYFIASLDAAQEVDTGSTTSAVGQAVLELDASESQLRYTILIDGLDLGGQTTIVEDDVVAAHIHNAPVGENGGVVFGLIGPDQDPQVQLLPFFPDPAAPIAGGVLRGDWSDDDPANATLSASLEALNNGELYFNIHSAAFPGGAIRGQILPVAQAACFVDTPTALVEQQYLDFLDRASDANGLVFWSQTNGDGTLNLEQLIAAFLLSEELQSQVTNPDLNEAFVELLYLRMLRRPVEPAGLAFWAGRLDEGAPLEAVIRSFIDANEYLARLGDPVGVCTATLATLTAESVLSGGQEVPPVTSGGAGVGSVTIDPVGQTLDVVVDYAGLVDTQQIHIHVGAAGSNGAVMFFLCSNLGNGPPGTPACPVTGGQVTATLTPADLIVSDTVANFSAAVTALQGGQAYFNIHTSANPAGELRGQIGAVALESRLQGENEVPPIGVESNGRGALRFDPAQSQLFYEVRYSDIQGVTQAHIHLGARDENGPVAVFLCSNLGNGPGDTPPCPEDGGLLRGALTAEDLVLEGLSFDEFVLAVLEGLTYLNIHTTANPSGEIRGQLTPVATDEVVVPAPAEGAEPGPLENPVDEPYGYYGRNASPAGDQTAFIDLLKLAGVEVDGATQAKLGLYCGP